MESTREPEPNETKEITFYGYSMKAPLNDTPSAQQQQRRQQQAQTKKSHSENLDSWLWTLCECVVRSKRKEKSLSEMMLTKCSMAWDTEIRP